MWCNTAPGIVCQKIRDDKGADTIRTLVGGYPGVIVCDALKTHQAGARANEQIQLAGVGRRLLWHRPSPSVTLPRK